MKRTSKASKLALRRARNRKPAFLAAFAISASISAAADAAKVSRSAHYDWLRADKKGKYAAQFADAMVQARQVLIDSAVQAALIGDFEPNVYQGRFLYPQEQFEIEPAKEAGDWKDLDADGKPRVATPAVLGWRDVPGAMPLGVYRKSTALKLALLRAWCPEFRVNEVQVSGKDGGPIQSTHRIVFVKPAPDGD
jgi:hypothetical protein